MHHEMPPFLGLEKTEAADYDDARAVVLPLPFERTVSWGSGTARGPRALLEASAYVEIYDEELDAEPWRHGIHTAEAFLPEQEDLGECMDAMAAEARRHLEAGKFLVSLGGEHSLTQAPVRAAKEVAEADGEPLGVVQFDAHADLRREYGGTPYSHASVMRRVVDDLGLPILGVGIRALSPAEAELVKERELPMIWSHVLHDDARRGSTERFGRLLADLPRRIYLTFDVDYFDPSLVPATGTPEPGGGFWHPTMQLLRLLFATKEVVAMDVVELAPLDDQPASDFVAAKLVYKCLGYRFD